MKPKNLLKNLKNLKPKTFSKKPSFSSTGHNAQLHRRTDRRKDRQRDDSMMPIADHISRSTMS